MTFGGIWQLYRKWYFKIVQNTKSREAASGIWIILKYYEPVLGVSMWKWVLASELEENTVNTRE